MKAELWRQTDWEEEGMGKTIPTSGGSGVLRIFFLLDSVLCLGRSFVYICVEALKACSCLLCIREPARRTSKKPTNVNISVI